MVTVQQAKKIASNEREGLIVTSAVRYRDYYVFFMQKEKNPSFENTLLDSYVFVNYKTGKVEYKSIFMFNDFHDKAVPIKV